MAGVCLTFPVLSFAFLVLLVTGWVEDRINPGSDDLVTLRPTTGSRVADRDRPGPVGAWVSLEFLLVVRFLLLVVVVLVTGCVEDRIHPGSDDWTAGSRVAARNRPGSVGAWVDVDTPRTLTTPGRVARTRFPLLSVEFLEEAVTSDPCDSNRGSIMSGGGMSLSLSLRSCTTPGRVARALCRDPLFGSLVWLVWLVLLS